MLIRHRISPFSATTNHVPLNECEKKKKMNAIRRLLAVVVLPTILAFFVSACGVEPNEPIAGKGLVPEVVSVRIIGPAEIQVEFVEPAGEFAEYASSYSIQDTDSRPLEVKTVQLDESNTEATLVTAEINERADYTMSIINGVQAVTITRNERPRVVGAVASSNTTVIVTFTKKMGDGAEVATNYFIAQENESSEAGVLHVTSARLLLPEKTAVELATLPQNETVYTLHVVNVRDVFGSQMAPPQLLVDPSRATFRGLPTNCEDVCSDGSGPCDDACLLINGGPGCICRLLDSDGDGLPDHVEQAGWGVEVELTSRDGVFDRRPPQLRDVTSDPLIADTDGDGLSDFTERELATDPRNPDTDGDGISDAREFNLFFSNPIDQDSDEDHLDDFLQRANSAGQNKIGRASCRERV